MQVLISPGDEVILLAPYWMTYSDQVSLAGGIPVVVDCLAENQFVPTREALESKITPRTRAIMVNSPCNPTGAVYPLEALQVIAELARANNLWLVCDEIYEKLVYGVKHYSIAAFEGMADQTITIGGCSKTFSMTGWRLGFAAAPLAVAKAMSNFQDQVTSNPTSFVQKAAIAAFGMAPAKVEVMRAEFEARRNVMKDELMKLPGIEVPSPKGAFYFFVDVRQFLGGDFPDDMALAETILERAMVATVPGSVFGAPGFIRLSYTADQNNIRRGVARIGDLLNSSGV